MDKVWGFLFLTGMVFWQSASVHWLLRALKMRFQMNRQLGRLTNQEELRRRGRVRKHLWMLIHAAESEKFFPTVDVFLAASLIIVAAITGLLQLLMPWQQAAMWAAAAGLMPYGFLQARLHERRVSRSKEGDVLIQELLNQYQMHHYNMLEAIAHTAMHLETAPMGRHQYLQLAKGLQNAVTKQEVEDQLSVFRYAFDTAWGNVLTSNIFFAHLYGIRVDGALKDLLASMIQSRKAVEYGRRENHEARMMLIYLAPASYLLSIFFACRYFDFTTGKFFSYQLGTPLGIQWFLAIVFCYTVSLLIQLFFAKEKMDI